MTISLQSRPTNLFRNVAPLLNQGPTTMNMRSRLLHTFCLLALCASSAIADDPAAKLISVKKIWDDAPHSAFTDLIFHNGRFFCVFREGQGHVSKNGALRILTSPDGSKWESAAVITSQDSDLRDAKIFVAPDGRLCLSGAGAWHTPQNGMTHQSFIWYSADGKNWGNAIPVGDPNFWLWRIIPCKNELYAFGYDCTKGTHSLRLYKSEDGKTFTTHVKTLNNDGYINETGALTLPDETMVVVARRDNAANNTDALIGTAKPPYTDWTFKKSGVRIGGPQVLQLPDGRIVVAGRDYLNKATTKLWWLDPATAKLTDILTLPSGGDTSYPGLVYRNGHLFVSYYSSHEGKTSIYFAEVQL